MITIVPSLPAKDLAELTTLADALRGVVPELQIDIVDGQFVEAVAWPFTEADPVVELQKVSPLCEDFILEFDCMVNNPLQYLDTLVAVGAKRIIVHYASTDDYLPLLEHARTHGYLLGLAITNSVDLAEVHPLVEQFDFVQVMGIKTIGKQGEPFDPATFETIRSLHRVYPTLPIAVDGGVNAVNVVELVAAGATRLAPGSAIVKQADPVAAYRQILSLVQ